MSDPYRDAGVDLEAAAAAVERIRDLAAAATRPEVMEGVGGFAGLFKLADGRLLAAATDGVGTKTEIARRAGRLDTVGIDLVAMCANDVVCTGAEPLFFLDYLAVGRVIPEETADLVAGVAEGCRRAGCALLGGETAEHPGVMDPDEFDLAGFCVGIVAEDALLGPHRVAEGDALIGLRSSGLHSNGYSLVRKVLADHALELGHMPPELDRPLAEELLEPTEIYVRPVLAAARAGLIHAAAHVTGGGFPENLPRMLPQGLAAKIEMASWEVPGVFRFLALSAETSLESLFDTFNMGVGMVLAVPEGRAEDALATLATAGARPFRIGAVVAGQGVHLR